MCRGRSSGKKRRRRLLPKCFLLLSLACSLDFGFAIDLVSDLALGLGIGLGLSLAGFLALLRLSFHLDPFRLRFLDFLLRPRRTQARNKSGYILAPLLSDFLRSTCAWRLGADPSTAGSVVFASCGA